MNSINFNQEGGAPIDLDVFAFMQNTYTSAIAGLAGMAGNYAIISGCDLVSGVVSDGYVVIDGEVLPFKGGILGAKVKIVEQVTQVIFLDGQAKDFQKIRYACFGTTGVDWSLFRKIKDLLTYINTANFYGGKNKIINGNFVINQRGYISGTATSIANQYTLDRWRIVGSGGSITFANNVADNGKSVTIPSSVVLQQVIEAQEMPTGTYTLSWTGTATATVNGTTISNGGQIVITYGSNVTIAFTNGTLSRVQFEMNCLSTAFEFRPYDIELTLCRRYFERVGVPYGKIFMEANYNVYSGISFFYHEKRTLPTVSFFQPLDAYTVSSGSYVSNAKTVSVVSNTAGVVGITYSANINLLWLAFTSSIVDVSAEL